jgi:hypothetical protein
MNHTWTIIKLQTQDNDSYTNIVTGIEWQLTTTDGTHTINVGKLQPIDFVEGDFTLYENLSEEQVKKWLFDSMGDRKQLFEEQGEIVINKKYRPQNNLPWI